MNGGKSHAFFTWASTDAWVPPIYFDDFDLGEDDSASFIYSNVTSRPPVLATHDPIDAHMDQQSGHFKPWVRPDFVVKADDDSFLILAELEARLRATSYCEDGESIETSGYSSPTRVCLLL